MLSRVLTFGNEHGKRHPVMDDGRKKRPGKEKPRRVGQVV